MSAEKEDRPVIVENVLRTVAMMHIPVGNQYTPNSVLLLGMPSGNRNVVEYAESHPTDWSRVMTGWTNSAKCVLGFALQHRVDTVQHTPHSLE